MEDEQNFHSSLKGRIGEKIGEGRQKKAWEVDLNKVWVRYHNEEFKDKPVEFFKAQYFMHRILHVLAPANFPDVHMAVKGGILLDRAAESPDFTRANELLEKLLKNDRMDSSLPKKDWQWVEDKAQEIHDLPKFVKIADMLEQLGIINIHAIDARERSRYELALPFNTVVDDDEPMVLELFDPATQISVDGKPKSVPTLSETGLDQVLASSKAEGKLDDHEIKEIKRMYHRYYENTVLATRTK